MKKNSSGKKISHQGITPDSHQIPASGPDGVAFTPPTRGIDFVDNRSGLQEADSALSDVVLIQRKATLFGAGTDEGIHLPNHSGLPDSLKSGIENVSGLSLDDVRVHYNSPKPAQLQALAYAQGADIHVGPGQERHLPHEAWHVVQQKQGRVSGTDSIKGSLINSDRSLEQEASMMGALGQVPKVPGLRMNRQRGIQSGSAAVVQRQSLNDIYDERVKDNKEKAKFLADFVRLLALLKNKDSVLQILRTHLFQDANWLGRLDAAESGTFSTARPTLIGFVPPAFFLAMLGAMQGFQDMLGRGHGIYTHRIQWFVFKYAIEKAGDFNHTVKELYQEIADPFWMHGKKTMWDQVVDRTEMEDVFAAPEWLMFILNSKALLDMQKDDLTADATTKEYLGIWKDDGPGDQPIRNIFDQIAIDDLIFTGFNQASGKPSVVYKSSEKDLIPKGA